MENNFILNKSYLGKLRSYKIDPATSSLIIDGKYHEIPNFFNLENAMAEDFKTLDYIFHYLGFEIQEFKGYKETNGVIYTLNPTKELIKWHLENSVSKAFKGFLTEEDDLRIRDKFFKVSNEIFWTAQKISGISFDIDYVKNRYIIVSSSEIDKLKLSASPRIQALGLEIL